MCPIKPRADIFLPSSSNSSKVKKNRWDTRRGEALKPIHRYLSAHFSERACFLLFSLHKLLKDPGLWTHVHLDHIKSIIIRTPETHDLDAAQYFQLTKTFSELITNLQNDSSTYNPPLCWKVSLKQRVVLGWISPFVSVIRSFFAVKEVDISSPFWRVREEQRRRLSAWKDGAWEALEALHFCTPSAHWH